MNAKTLQRVTNHGQAILDAFPACQERDPVALCRKLRRIETQMHKAAMEYGQGVMHTSELNKAMAFAKERAWSLLGNRVTATNALRAEIEVDSDWRGYQLKLSPQWTTAFNDRQDRLKRPSIHTDMGGYGVLAPDLSKEES